MLTLPTPRAGGASGLALGVSDRVPRWLREVPLYQRRTLTTPGAGADLAGQGDLRYLPFITKDDIRRDFPSNFLRHGVDLDTLLAEELVELEHTSGTSEGRTPLLLGRGWWVEQEQRALRLNPTVARVLDWAPEARRVTLTSPVCNGDICYTGVPTHAERVVGSALHVNLTRHPFLWGRAELARMAAETAAWEPQFLDVDPVYGVLFARYCERQGIRLPTLEFVLCSYEFVSVNHRQVLERVFGVPVLNLYGSTETGHLLMEDERGRMVPSLETAFLEVLDPDARGVGELVVTTLTNEYMPLIRYRIGDLVEPLEAGRRLTYRVHGRRADAFTAATGERVTTLAIDECFVGLTGFLHYQLVETDTGACRLRYVTDRVGPSSAHLAELERRLRHQLRLDWVGALTLEETDALMAESSGKFRLGYPRSARG
ncbi:MAG: phenylacetate--CoA ligase family protein [Verrucomicrobia bacterium]|nr:phenylacetate--CoA ligase family protein [Verrucomicrobiota bacterium]